MRGLVEAEKATCCVVRVGVRAEVGRRGEVGVGAAAAEILKAQFPAPLPHSAPRQLGPRLLSRLQTQEPFSVEPSRLQERSMRTDT